MIDKEQLIDALDSVTWYNGLAKYVWLWAQPGYLRKSEYGLLTRSERYCSDKEVEAQLEVIWMICVELFGDCGTSPRSGWIEKCDEFYQFCNDIIKTWRESDDYVEEAMEMGKSIKVSEKYGVNPTIPICFWCGEKKNEVVLLGKLKGDAKAPESTWINGDYEPCDACKAKMDKGITIMQALEAPVAENQHPYQDAYPTGSWFVMTESGIRKLLDEEAAEQAIKMRKVFADTETYSAILDKIHQDILGKEDNTGDDKGDD